MKICFIADGNSIHARRWIEYFCRPENEVHIVSTTYCTKPVAGAIVYNLIVIGEGSVEIDGIGIGESPHAAESQSKPSISRIGRLVPKWVQDSEFFHITYLLYTVFKFRKKAKAIIAKLQPDIVHCLRVPIEGYLGGLVGYRPLALSTWGNDMVYFARKYAICRWLTRKAMSQADLYFSDSLRDKYIAEAYDFSPSSPVGIMAVTGGLKFEEIPIMKNKTPAAIKKAKQKLGISPEENLLISVRGFKNFYVYTETLIRAIPQIIQVFPNTVFVLKGNTQTEEYLKLRELAKEFDVERYIRFTDRLGVEELIDYFTASDIMVSVTLYDGCPVSMLEGMAYGLIPAMSIHSPIQEWISDGYNGYMFDPRDPADIARTIIRALENKPGFDVMRKRNWDMLGERADFYNNMKIAEEMYRQVIDKTKKLSA